MPATDRAVAPPARISATSGASPEPVGGIAWFPPEVVVLPVLLVVAGVAEAPAETVKLIVPLVCPLSSSVTAAQLIVYLPASSAGVVIVILVRSALSTADVTPDVIAPPGPVNWAEDWSGLRSSLNMRVISVMPVPTLAPLAGPELLTSACAEATPGATRSTNSRAGRTSAAPEISRAGMFSLVVF